LVGLLALPLSAQETVPPPVGEVNLTQPVDGSIPGTKRYNVTFNDRKFNLEEFRTAVESGKDADHVEGIVARLQGMANAERDGFRGAIEALGGRVHITFWLIDVCTIDIPEDKLDAVRALPGVAIVAPDLPAHPAILTATNVSNHNTDAVQAAGNRGTGFGVAVIDTGQDSNMGGVGRPHRTYFRNGNLAITNAGGLNGSLLLANVAMPGAQPADDTHGHGTGVMGIAAGSIWGGAGADNGHANDAYKVGYGICATAGSCSTSLAMEAAAWQQAATDKVRYNIVSANMSYGSSPNLLDVSQQAIDGAALNANILSVCAAGNSGTGGTGGSAAVANGLAVAAANNNTKTVSGFSTRGPMGTRTYPDIMANGVSTVMPGRNNDSGNFVASGTSMASPQVCGTGALVKFARPNASAREIKALLLASSENVAGTENEVGQGYLRSDRAVACANSPDSAITSSIASTVTPNDHLLAVTSGQVVKVALTWFRHNLALATYSNLGLTVLNGAATIATKNSAGNLYEVVSFTAPITGNLIVRVNAVSLVQNPQPYSLAACATSGTQPRFQGGPTGAVVISGAGCVGTGGIPSLHPSGNPAIGGPLGLNVTYARPSTPAIMILGTSSIAVDLTGFGAPTCFLRASTDVLLFFAIGATGTGGVPLGIPNNLGLVSAILHIQSLIVDPPINALDLVATNSMRVTIGTR
jgi:hypothetical protein